MMVQSFFPPVLRVKYSVAAGGSTPGPEVYLHIRIRVHLRCEYRDSASGLLRFLCIYGTFEPIHFDLKGKRECR